MNRAKYTKRLAFFTAGVSSAMALAMIGLAIYGPVWSTGEPAAASEVSTTPAAPPEAEAQPQPKPTQRKART